MAFIRQVVADNLQRKMVARYGANVSENARITRLAKEAKVGRSTLQRILKCEFATTVDRLEKLASALRCETYELLMEDKDRG